MPIVSSEEEQPSSSPRARLRRKGRTTIFVQADVSTAEGTTKVINEILNRFQGIDIIIHNVGGTSAPCGGFITVTDEIWQQALNENLFPPFGWTVVCCRP